MTAGHLLLVAAIGLAATTLVPGAEVTFTIGFSPGGTGTRTAKLQIASNDPEVSSFEIFLTGRQATPTEAWRLAYFGDASSTGPGADLNDPDRDGLVNLLEYATNSNPLVATPSIGQLVKNGNTLEFTCTRPQAAAAEVSCVREFSETLSGTWSRVGGTVDSAGHPVFP